MAYLAVRSCNVDLVSGLLMHAVFLVTRKMQECLVAAMLWLAELCTAWLAQCLFQPLQGHVLQCTPLNL